MAIYRMSAKTISRSKGQNAIAAAAYRSGEKLHDQSDNKVKDYGRKSGVLHSKILLPKTAPAELKDRQTLWNQVELSEKRKDSQLAREIQFALPREQTQKQNQKLIFDYCRKEFVSRGMIADINIHDEHKGNGNKHAHVMLTTRAVDENGFGQKNRDWNNKELLLSWRESWAKHVNKSLESNGHDERIDHRTKAVQEVEKTENIWKNEVEKLVDLSGKICNQSIASHYIEKRGEPSWQVEQIRKAKEQFESFRKHIQARIKKAEAKKEQKKTEKIREKEERVRAKAQAKINKHEAWFKKCERFEKSVGIYLKLTREKKGRGLTEQEIKDINDMLITSYRLSKRDLREYSKEKETPERRKQRKQREQIEKRLSELSIKKIKSDGRRETAKGTGNGLGQPVRDTEQHRRFEWPDRDSDQPKQQSNTEYQRLDGNPQQTGQGSGGINQPAATAAEFHGGKRNSDRSNSGPGPKAIHESARAATSMDAKVSGAFPADNNRGKPDQIQSNRQAGPGDNKHFHNDGSVDRPQVTGLDSPDLGPSEHDRKLDELLKKRIKPKRSRVPRKPRDPGKGKKAQRRKAIAEFMDRNENWFKKDPKAASLHLMKSLKIDGKTLERDIKANIKDRKQEKTSEGKQREPEGRGM